MKQTVLEKSAYLAPACKLVNAHLEGVICWSVTASYSPGNLTEGVSGWFENE